MAVLGKDASSRKRSVGLLILGQYMRYDEPHHNTPISLLDLKLMKWRKFRRLAHSFSSYIVITYCCLHVDFATDPVSSYSVTIQFIFRSGSLLHFFQVQQGQFMISYMKSHLSEIYTMTSSVKDEVEFWSCDCIVKETVWNRPEKVDHLA